MNANDVLTLAKAGFTAAQIAALMQTAQVPATPPTPVPATPPTPVPATPPTPVPATPPTPVPAPSDPIMAQIEKLTGIIQANALLSTNMPQTMQTADDVLAEIINPPTPPVSK